jgi:membrane protein YdbS with pleckstrin-like domain
MHCPQCGNEAPTGVAFCSRCGTRLVTPRPEQRHEYALVTVLPSWWRFATSLGLATISIAAGLSVMAHRHDLWRAGLLLAAFGVALFGLTAIARRALSWSLTSERLIERRGILANRRREIELVDIRSVEVDRRLLQRMAGLGNVTVASAASADFLVRLEDIHNPDAIAEQLRQARLKRLA